ncbi:MAG: EF-hand domain-containing protein [Flavobacteriaceae bacterium]
MKNRTLKLSIYFGAIAILASCQIKAQQQDGNSERKQPPSFEELIEMMDENKDGKLSEKEVKGPLKKDFDKVDLNEDGYISEEEFKKAPKPERKGGPNRN